MFQIERLLLLNIVIGKSIANTLSSFHRYLIPVNNSTTWDLLAYRMFLLCISFFMLSPHQTHWLFQVSKFGVLSKFFHVIPGLGKVIPSSLSTSFCSFLTVFSANSARASASFSLPVRVFSCFLNSSTRWFAFSSDTSRDFRELPTTWGWGFTIRFLFYYYFL